MKIMREMKTAEELQRAAENLRGAIRIMIEEFVEKHGECSVEIRTWANFIEINQKRNVYSGHEIEVNVTV